MSSLWLNKDSAWGQALLILFHFFVSLFSFLLLFLVFNFLKIQTRQILPSMMFLQPLIWQQWSLAEPLKAFYLSNWFPLDFSAKHNLPFFHRCFLFFGIHDLAQIVWGKAYVVCLSIQITAQPLFFSLWQKGKDLIYYFFLNDRLNFSYTTFVIWELSDCWLFWNHNDFSN